MDRLRCMYTDIDPHEPASSGTNRNSTGSSSSSSFPMERKLGQSKRHRLQRNFPLTVEVKLEIDARLEECAMVTRDGVQHNTRVFE